MMTRHTFLVLCTLATAARLRLVDMDGKLLYERTVDGVSGQTVSLVVAPTSARR